MTAEKIVRYAVGRPFVPFTLTLVDGRELHVQQPDQIGVGEYVFTATYFHPTRQLEIIDVDHIVSIRTIFPVARTANR